MFQTGAGLSGLMGYITIDNASGASNIVCCEYFTTEAQAGISGRAALAETLVFGMYFLVS